MKRAEDMRAVFARFEESGLTLKAFGEREKIAYTTLQYWRRKLREGSSGRKRSHTASGSADLAPVRVVPDPALVDRGRGRFEVWLANGVSLDVPAGFDEGELRRLVVVLSGC